MKIHFIGVGGIGISALAHYYLTKGEKVSGSDLCGSEITNNLSGKGAKIYVGKHKQDNLSKDTNIVIHSLAIEENNPELQKARRYKMKVKSYPQALGELTKRYSTIAVCGTHGKTTVTALLSLILIRAGLDPSVVIGTKLKELGNSNYRVGGGKYLVIEADEYKSAFLNYWPEIIVLISIEREHLDYYKDLRHISRVFREFIDHLPRNGILVANEEDENIRRVVKKLKNQGKEFKIVFYSLAQKELKKIKEILKIPGRFNASNALAALNVARLFNIPDRISFESLSRYHGAWRRFEISPCSLNDKFFTLVSDYGHHPTQIKVTLKAAREKFSKRRIILVYQPHQFKRTKVLLKEFVKSFDETDILILNEIYKVSGREFKSKEKISSRILSSLVQKRWEKLNYEKLVTFIEDQKSILKKLKTIIKKNDVVIVMGAGDIYNLSLEMGKYFTS